MDSLEKAFLPEEYVAEMLRYRGHDWAAEILRKAESSNNLKPKRRQ